VYDIEQPYGPPIETTMRLATWNVWGRYGPWDQREPGIIETLGRARADVVVLTEAWDGQCDRLAGPLGLPHHVFRSWTGDGGLAVLSRWPILYHADQPLGSQPPPDGGRVLFVELDGPRGPIQVYAVMLAWRLDHSAIRQGQVHDLAAYIVKAQNTRGPVIIAGDFNAGPDSDEIRMLTGQAGSAAPGLVCYDAWEMAGSGGPGHTWSNANPWAAPALWPERRIDHIFSAWPRRGGAGHPVHCEVIGTEPVDGLVPSDHYGLLADLRY
jgi:endonuclease/exonuclease/phosphatase family metal-dependent hydrolase